MEKAERIELNKLWAELRVMQLLTARLAVREFSADELEAWYQRMITMYEDRTDVSYISQASMVPALERMGQLLRDARDAVRPPPAP